MGKNARSKDVIGKEHEMYALTYGDGGVQVSVGRQFQAEALLNSNHDAPNNDDVDNAKGKKEPVTPRMAPKARLSERRGNKDELERGFEPSELSRFYERRKVNTTLLPMSIGGIKNGVTFKFKRLRWSVLPPPA